MKTLVAIIENYPYTKTTFGAVLSKASGIPLFDVDKYLTKHTATRYGPLVSLRNAWEDLLNDIGKHERAIVENMPTGTITEKVYGLFGHKIIVLSEGVHNLKLGQRLNVIIDHGHPNISGKAIDTDKFTFLVKMRADDIKKMKPTFIYPLSSGSVDYSVDRVMKEVNR